MTHLRTRKVSIGAVLFAVIALGQAEQAAGNAGKSADPNGILLRPIPEKLVVLTFDDACLSHATFVGPLLKKYGFGVTLYITTFGKAVVDTTKYMSWEQIKALEGMGFEIGNHSIGHGYMGLGTAKDCTTDLIGIEDLCLNNQVSKPTTFCWPIYSVNTRLFTVMVEKGYLFARGGHERAYRPTADNPFDAPSFTIHDENLQNKDRFANAAKQATNGSIVIFTFHGVPDLEHPTVGVEPGRFEELMKYLKDNQYTVIAMRDLARYVDAAKAAQLLSFRRTQIWGGVTSKGYGEHPIRLWQGFAARPLALDFATC